MASSRLRPLHAKRAQPRRVVPAADGGFNVVTTCGAGSSVHSTGSSPGFITEALPLVLTSIQRQLNALTIDEYANLSQRNSPQLLFDLMGFGRPAGSFEQFRADYLSSSFGPSLRLVADAIGLTLDSVEARGKHCCTTDHDLRHPRRPATVPVPGYVVLHDGSGSRVGPPRDRLACVGRRRRATRGHSPDAHPP